MKRLLFLSVMAALLLGASAATYDVEYNGMYFKLNSSYTEATLVKGDIDYFGNITVPSTIPYLHITVPVKSVQIGAFSNTDDIDTITISKGVSLPSIGSSSVKKIVFKGDNSFRIISKTCTKLMEIEIQGAVTFDSTAYSTAFNGVNLILFSPFSFSSSI